MDKMSQWRLEGMGYALAKIDEVGLEAFKDEFRYRSKMGVTWMPKKREFEEFRKKVTNDALKVAFVFAIYALHDEFGFGAERCERFKRRYEQKAEHFTEGLYAWQEMAEMLKEETGMEVHFE